MRTPASRKQCGRHIEYLVETYGHAPWELLSVNRTRLRSRPPPARCGLWHRGTDQKRQARSRDRTRLETRAGTALAMPGTPASIAACFNSASAGGRLLVRLRAAFASGGLPPSQPDGRVA